MRRRPHRRRHSPDLGADESGDVMADQTSPVTATAKPMPDWQLEQMRRWCANPSSEDEFGYDCARYLLAEVDRLRGLAPCPADEARAIVTEWLGMFDPPPQIDFQQSEFLQQAIAVSLRGSAPEPHETTYLRGWNEAIERCAEIAESSAVTRNGTKIGIGIATKIREQIAALSDTSTGGNSK